MSKVSVRSIGRLQLSVILINVLIPMVFLFFSQSVVMYFNPHFHIPLSEKSLKFGITLPILVIFFACGSIVAVIVYRLLLNLKRYFQSGTHYKQARRIAVSIPWILIIFHTTFWAAGDLAFYISCGFDAPNGVPFLFSIFIMSSSGLMSGTTCSLIIKNLLLPYKQELNIKEIYSGERDFFSMYRDYICNGVSLVYSFSFIGYAIRFFHQYGIEFGNQDYSLFPMIVLFLFLSMSALVLLYFSKREYLYQVHDIQKKVNDLSTGQIDLSDRIVLVNFDEIGTLGEKINVFLERFSQILYNMKDLTLVLSESTNSLSVGSSQIATTSQQQASAVQEIAKTVGDASDMLKDAEQRIGNIHINAERSNLIVVDGVKALGKTIEQIQEIKETNESTITGVKNLEKQVSSISELSSSINKLADQTKIIAFNAELEASSAGEQGKNFEIVANEIRRLADSTTEFTQNIRDEIILFFRTTETLGKSIRENTEYINTGWDMSRMVVDLFDEIQQVSANSSESTHNLLVMMKQLVGSMEQIVITISQISDGVQNFSNSTVEMNESVGNLKERADKITDIVKLYS